MCCPQHTGIFISEAYQVQNKTIFYTCSKSLEKWLQVVSAQFFMYKRTHQKAVLVDSNSSLSSVESHGITSMKKKKRKVLLTTILFPTNHMSLAHFVWLYEQTYKGGNVDRVFMIIRDCFLIYLSYTLFLTESKYN